MMNQALLIYREAVMDSERKSALGEQACAKILRQCARATGTVTKWVVEML